jgi:hypothetical protein
MSVAPYCHNDDVLLINQLCDHCQHKDVGLIRGHALVLTAEKTPGQLRLYPCTYLTGGLYTAKSTKYTGLVCKRKKLSRAPMSTEQPATTVTCTRRDHPGSVAATTAAVVTSSASWPKSALPPVTDANTVG